MWLITPVGFFSIVRKPGDLAAGTLTVRARSREDLEALAATLPSLGPIADRGGTDYPYRARVPRDALAEAFAAMLRGIDYPNFKDVVAARQGPERAATYGEVWSTLLALTPGARPSPRDRFRRPRLSR
jgi:hypothetical protein